MSLVTGTRLGAFEILGQLGAGGMGEVYRARDPRLEREVAIKVLPTHLAADPDARERFEREARAIAALNHPHICTVHDVGREGDVDFLVLELLEGQTLEERLCPDVPGPTPGVALPIAEALSIARQIADALDKAHRLGIVHRDLKPGNVMLTRAGAKVLDFGLAKVTRTPGGGGRHAAALSQSPTYLSPAPLTAHGMVLGTVQYMAPEQVEGREADARTDIFALGVVIYEMVTGRRAFEGRSQASVMAAILEHEPRPMTEGQPLTPPALDRLVRTCLAKDPDDRWQSARDVWRELAWVADRVTQDAVPVARASTIDPRRAGWIWPAVAAASLVLGAAGMWVWATWTAPAPRLLQLSITVPPEATTTAGAAIGLAPDGRRIAFSAAAPDGRNQLWLRSLDRPTPQPVGESLNTSGWLFWSPDSESFGYGGDGKLRILDIATGQSRVLGDAPGLRGGSWAADGTILFAPSEGSGLFRVAAAGGSAVAVTVVDDSNGESSHRSPWFLPDGRHFLFRVQSARDDIRGVFLGSLDGAVKRRLLNADSHAIYVQPGFLLYVADGTLFAHPFDDSNLTLSGSPLPLARSVAFNAVTGTAAFAASQTGAIAYRSGPQGFRSSELHWVDRTGRSIETLKLPPGNYSNVETSNSGKIAVQRADGQNADIWVIDTSGAPPRRVTFDPNGDESPMWSPDESRLLFFSSRPGPGTLFLKSASGTGEEQLLVKSNDRSYPGGWSPDGRLVAYATRMPDTKWDLYYLAVDGDREPQPLAVSPFNEQHPQFSPDGRWVAYTSDESGANEVYVQSFPSGAGKVRISTTGGMLPRWRRDGGELFYFQSDRSLMAVDVARASDGPRAGAPKALFAMERTLQLLNPSGQAAGYAPSADGQRFLISRVPPVPAEDQAIDVILHWTELLK